MDGSTHIPRPPARPSRVILTPRQRPSSALDYNKSKLLPDKGSHFPLDIPSLAIGRTSPVMAHGNDATRPANERANNSPWIASVFRFRPSSAASTSRPASAPRWTKTEPRSPSTSGAGATIAKALPAGTTSCPPAPPLSAPGIKLEASGYPTQAKAAMVHRFHPATGTGHWVTLPVDAALTNQVHSDMAQEAQPIPVKLGDGHRYYWPVAISLTEKSASSVGMAGNSARADVRRGDALTSVADTIRHYAHNNAEGLPQSVKDAGAHSSIPSASPLTLTGPYSLSLGHGSRDSLMAEVAAYRTFAAFAKAFNLRIKGIEPSSPRHLWGGNELAAIRKIQPGAATSSPRSAFRNTSLAGKVSRPIYPWEYLKEEHVLAYSRDTAVLDLKLLDGEQSTVLTARIDDPPLAFKPQHIRAVDKAHEAAASTRLATVSGAFAHYSLVYSKRALAMQILSFDGNNCPVIVAVHTNSSIEDPSDIPFGEALNGQRTAIIKLIRKHVCNELCRSMDLPPIMIL